MTDKPGSVVLEPDRSSEALLRQILPGSVTFEQVGVPLEINVDSLSLIVVFGPARVGKSTVSKKINEELSKICKKKEIVRINSDEVRIAISGKEGRRYTKEESKETYEQMHLQAEEAINKGKIVILDATYTDPKKREDIRLVADRLGIQPLFIYVTTSRERVEERLSGEVRRDSEDPSQAEIGHYHRDMNTFSANPPTAPYILVKNDGKK